MGLDITLQRVSAYRVFDAGGIVITVSQMFPIADAEEFTVSPQRADARAVAERRKGSRERSTVVRLIAAKSLPDGTALTLAPTNEVTADVRDQILSWIAADPRRGRATWHNDAAGPLEWEYDGNRYRPTPIVQQILQEAAGEARSPRGPRWWRDSDGRDLPVIAGLGATGFDWKPLHDLLARIPAGKWTTYGDAAAVVGTGAQALGQHITGCEDCVNGHRVLGVDGRPAPGFIWSDPTETRTQREVLESEGVSFDSGRADPAARITQDDLRG
jgi:alkylated DNA nucleotide flippase Atl1